jgi:hypothetical protein
MRPLITRHKIGTMCGARCTAPGCGGEINSASADTWAENHARRTGHTVELRMGWLVKRKTK